MWTRLLALVATLASCHPADPPRTPVATVPPDAATFTPDAPITIAEVKHDARKPEVERPDPAGATTVKEYTFEPATRLTPVAGTAGYAKLGKPRVIRFAINTWAGWAPVLLANQGAKPKRIWKDSKGGEFQVELVVVDNPTQLLATLSAGKLHIGWATVDMLPLVVQQLRDPRTLPRVFQQVDWSNGGDGLVVRDGIRTVADLRGKTIVLAQSSPSHYFLLNLLLNAGLQPSDVTL